MGMVQLCRSRTGNAIDDNANTLGVVPIKVLPLAKNNDITNGATVFETVPWLSHCLLFFGSSLFLPCRFS